ncbi:SusD-like starch-binding protein associating with outer membrane [Chitinophaga skermanii]|uniref:SusD-like starch-binding protein associating with outer membrane n=1 Tax=Chitinophaga skermanii TaxID=331697 RepID=A0A327QWE4_9BACT|nr:SusD/RagB family nutrient-binding outer membrane lipoprotein [Chitinophaga skermanii]RAJ08919.1 SusD-like starch-binding protein associating with outer membrane [Chitinophaga skermanii]
MKRNTLKYLIAFATVTASLAACDKGFESMNIDPNASGKPTVNFLFTKAQLLDFNADNTVNYFTNTLNCGNMIQHFSTFKILSGVGDKYTTNDLYQGLYFTNTYQAYINPLKDIIRYTNNEADANKNAVARIWLVYNMHRLTDLYGDVPYTQAGLGYTETIFSPKYDKQSEIYPQMLQELKDAATQLNASKTTFGSADIIFKGDVAQWKKFAYSLMLRLSMRLTKRDAALAEKWAKEAIAGGVILNDADNAIMKYAEGPQNLNRNPFAFQARFKEYTSNAYGATNNEGGKLSKTLIDFLKNNNDPRLAVYAAVWVGTSQDTAAAKQKGMPNGLEAEPTGFVTYSEPNQNTVFRFDAPAFVLTNAEMNFLLAEASLRNWYSGNAAALYKAGVEASLRLCGLYGAGGVISPAKITEYANARTFPATGLDAQMNEIHTQMWVLMFANEYEAFANWRRTGYPVLTPTKFSANETNGTIPRRLRYPQTEMGINGTNYYDALKNQGADLLITRVWWDK